MKSITCLTAALLAAAAICPLPAVAQPPAKASSARICLRVRDISDTSSKDGKILTFKMKDGTIYNNHLREPCDSLRFGGFAWTVAQTDDVCGDAQTLRTFVTGEICRLGDFDPPIKPHRAAH